MSKEKNELIKQYIYYCTKYTVYLKGKKIKEIVRNKLVEYFVNKKIDEIVTDDYILKYKKKMITLPPKKKDVKEEDIKPFIKIIKYEKINGLDVEEEREKLFDNEYISDYNPKINIHRDYFDIDQTEKEEKDYKSLFEYYKKKVINLLRNEKDNEYQYEDNYGDVIILTLTTVKKKYFDGYKFIKNKNMKAKYGIKSYSKKIEVIES